jgi:UDP-3-O-[3-hydroxymyristoyl] glucosamine N-acyltransferase
MGVQMKERTVKNWHKHCLLPDGTEMQEHSIKTDRNIVVGEFCQIDYGLRGADVYVGESSKIREYVWASGDVRIGNWCEVGNDVIAKQDAYIGEGAVSQRKTQSAGTLDIGERVEIKEGSRRPARSRSGTRCRSSSSSSSPAYTCAFIVLETVPLPLVPVTTFWPARPPSV